MSGPEIPGHRYVELVDEGGFASVYKYERQSLGKDVAVKVLRPVDGGLTKEEFQAEARIMAKLSGHPNIVTIYDYGTLADGRPYLVMEYCPPPNLKVRAEQERLSTRFVAEVAITIAGAVETAHRAQVLHRDIKPANILLDGYGAKLTDFGISELLGSGDRAGDGVSVPWAPLEALEGHETDARSDVYSLAATVYTLLTGRWPYELPGGGNELTDLVPRMRIGVPQPIGRGDVPPQLEDVLRRSLHRDPARRHASAREFALDVRAALPAEWALPSPQVPEEMARAAAALTMTTRRAGIAQLPPAAVAPSWTTTAWSAAPAPARSGADGLTVQRDRPAVQDLTGTVLRSPVPGPVPVGAGDVDDLTRARPVVTDSPPPGSSRTARLIGAAAAVVLGVGVVATLTLGGGPDGQDQPAAQPTTAFDPAANPGAVEAGQPAEGGWTRTPTTATVTWEPPADTQPGDEYQWQRVDPDGVSLDAAVTSQEAQAKITGVEQDDQVCVLVWVVRNEVPSSRKLRSCTSDAR